MSSDRKMSPLAECHCAGRGVTLLASGSSVTAMKLESESVGIALTCHLERNKRTFGNDDRQEWSLIGGKIHRESMTRRCKALFRDCHCRDVTVMSALS